MTEPTFRLVDGELIELTEAELLLRERDEQSALALAKEGLIASLQALADARVGSAMPDLELAQAIRAHQSDLRAIITGKKKLHTLAAVDITAGWPE